MLVSNMCRPSCSDNPALFVSLSPKAKNVAAEIAVQLCESVAKKLEGKVMGTFTSK